MGYRGKLDAQAEARPQRRPNRLRDRRLAEIAELDAAGAARIGVLSDEAFFAAGVALYAGEGAKADGAVKLANTNPAIIAFFCAWLRRFFDVDETRLRVTVYLHQGLDLDAAHTHWSEATGIPLDLFGTPYRPVVRGGPGRTKHRHGCAYVRYACSRTHRTIMGSVRALLSPGSIPG